MAQSTNMFAAWIYQHLMFLDDVVVHVCSHYSSVPGNKTKTRMHNKEKYYEQPNKEAQEVLHKI